MGFWDLYSSCSSSPLFRGIMDGGRILLGEYVNEMESHMSINGFCCAMRVIL
jgi:hypothetical protein